MAEAATDQAAGIGRVRPATSADVDTCTHVLARAFHDDPGSIVIEPDPSRRAAALPVFFRAFIVASLAEGGDLVVPEGDVTGIGCWFGPELHEPSQAAMDAADFGSVIRAFGPAATLRMAAMIEEIDRQHARLMPTAHLRLGFLGVDPDYQGRGIGSALVTHGLVRADRLGLPCFLETFTDADVRFYEHRGFAVVHSYAVGDGVPVYAMVHEPAL